MFEDFIGNLSPRLLDECVRLLAGEQIGSGISRTVFNLNLDPAKVLKVEDSGGRFQNVKEWEFWNEASHAPDVAKWLAPCHAISGCGSFLIMSKAHDLRPEEKPEKLPSFLTDHKLENFGLLAGKIVCRDYGYVRSDIRTHMRKWR